MSKRKQLEDEKEETFKKETKMEKEESSQNEETFKKETKIEKEKEKDDDGEDYNDNDKYARVVDEDNGKFVIVHVSNEFTSTTFKIKPDTLLKKLMKAFCLQRDLEYGSIRFIYEGNRIKEEDTVRIMGIESGEIIDALATQIGGC